MTDNAAGIGHPATKDAGRPGRHSFGKLFRQFGTFVILLLLLGLASLQSDAFLTERNLTNILRQHAGTGVMAVGMLYVILTRGIDLSVGSISALGAVLTAILVQDWPLWAALLMVVGIGAACGLVSGVLVAFLRLPAFVVTLAMLTAARGMALILSNGQPIMLGEPGAALAAFGTAFPLGIPAPALLMIGVFVLAFVVLNFSRFGRLVKAIGSNEEAVRLSGIVTGWYVMAVYVISGALAAIAGIIVTSRSGVGSASVGDGAELDVIAAVVIGGASLMGGQGGVVNTFLGVLILGIIGNIMNLAGVPGYHQQVYLGVIIVVAVVLQHASHILRRR